MNRILVSPFVVVLLTEVINVCESSRATGRTDYQASSRIVSNPQLRNEVFGLVFENASDAMLVLSDGRFIECNNAAVEMMGLESKEDIHGKSPADFSPFRQPDWSISE